MAVSNRMKSVRGFTLVELVIVMTLLAILSLMVTPVFRASFSGVRSDHAMRDLFAAMKSAQAGAITRAVEHRFYFAPEDNEYWIAREVVPEAGEPTFEALEGRAGEVVKLPQGLEMQKPSARRGSTS